MKKSRKMRYLYVPICAGIIAMMGTGTTMAYLNRPVHGAQNVITTGSAKAELKEDAWDSGKLNYLHPGESIPKNPVVENTGDNGIYAFLEVKIPIREITVVDEVSGRKKDRRKQELFTINPDEKNWKLISENESEQEKCYVYGYLSVLNPGELTTPLFQTVTAVSYLEGELIPEQVYEIPVTAKVIQSDLDVQEPERIYEKLLEQEKSDREGGKA